MLALIKNNPVLNRVDILGQFNEGGWCLLPDGSQVSPAEDGWELRGYYLKTIQDADPVPDGWQITSTSVEIVAGTPKYVNTLSAIDTTARPSIPVLSCIANLNINQFDITGVDTATGITVAFMMDIGVAMVFFAEPMQDLNYSWNVNSTIGRANVTNRATDYIEITVKGDNGEPAENAELAIQIFKVQ